MSEECLCDRCSALCCRYFALEIDEPATPRQFDDVRWYLAHENVHVFVEEQKWYLAVQTKCQFLRDDNKCGIYEDRPKICREYTTDNCDFHSGNYGFEHYFTTPEQIEAFAQEALGDKYRRYVLKQRMLNTGMDPKEVTKGHPGRPKSRDVLKARMRPGIRAHGAMHPHHAPSGDSNAMVQLSIRKSGE